MTRDSASANFRWFISEFISFAPISSCSPILWQTHVLIFRDGIPDAISCCANRDRFWWQRWILWVHKATGPHTIEQFVRVIHSQRIAILTIIAILRSHHWISRDLELSRPNYSRRCRQCITPSIRPHEEFVIRHKWDRIDMTTDEAWKQKDIVSKAFSEKYKR
jgi:hypothetical protein